MLGAICGDILGSTYEFQGIKYDEPDAYSSVMVYKGESEEYKGFIISSWLLSPVSPEIM